ncbi:hypothetical protein TRFO_38014 [Tritrichomonas foetus]|uniref:PARP alpha-helical domain-containing protein n=1 Tax=Tritrichomonas foetus TaxID=1144522 RepID=A0A1J4JC52_9EUKA|nr:hypothetical protein TRFO_38014 [Tritrichomonas foetus]|eukprot:OHS95831.1 hypothetical protein TRFO_38014 [Tritrichomonas foetus]
MLYEIYTITFFYQKLSLSFKVFNQMENHLLEKGTELLHQVTKIVDSYYEAQKMNRTPKILVLESKFFTLIENNKDFLNEMQSSQDELVIQLHEEIESRKSLFQQIIEVNNNDNQNLVEVDEVDQLNVKNMPHIRVGRTQNSVFNDFWNSMIFTIIVCILFAFIWSQYAKTH